VVFLALALRSFVVEAYQIPSGSMIPTLQIGDRIFVNKFLYGVRLPFTFFKIADGVRAPRAGEVIVFDHPTEKRADPLIKRIVAVPGDTVAVRDGVLYVNGRATVGARLDADDQCHYDDYLEADDAWDRRPCRSFAETVGAARFTSLRDPAGDNPLGWFGPVTVPPRSVFVMGDNRDNSSDSRVWGVVPYDHIRGRAMIVWWSANAVRGVQVDRLFQRVR
jgi:signal peptidase I